MHTGYTGSFTGLLELNNHVNFETTAQSLLTAILNDPYLNISYTYNDMHLLDKNVFVDQVAAFSSSYYSAVTAYDAAIQGWAANPSLFPWSLVEWANDNYQHSIKITLTRTLDYTATLMHKFMLDLGWQENGIRIQNNIVTGYDSKIFAMGHLMIPDGVTAIASGALPMLKCPKSQSLRV